MRKPTEEQNVTDEAHTNKIQDGETRDESPEKARPLDPKTGAVILLSSLGISLAVMWILSAAFPLGQRTLDLLPFPTDSRSVWIMIVSWLVFPAVFAVFCLRLAKGVDPFRLSLAFAGTTYFLQCWAELQARGNFDDLILWPELLFTAIPTLIVYTRASRTV